MRITCVHDELRIRRLNWLQDIHKHPEDNVQLRAALAGTLKTTQVEIHEEYSTWLTQMANDVEWYLKKSSEGTNDDDKWRGQDGLRTIAIWKES